MQDPNNNSVNPSTLSTSTLSTLSTLSPETTETQVLSPKEAAKLKAAATRAANRAAKLACPPTTHTARSVGNMPVPDFIALLSRAAKDSSIKLPVGQLEMFSNVEKCRTRIDSTNKGAVAQLNTLLARGWFFGIRRELPFKGAAALGISLRNTAETNTQMIKQGIVPPAKAVSFMNPATGEYIELPTAVDFITRANEMFARGYIVGRKGGTTELPISVFGYATPQNPLEHNTALAKFNETGELPTYAFRMESPKDNTHTEVAISRFANHYVKQLLSRGWRFGKTLTDSTFVSIKALDINPLDEMTSAELKASGLAMVFFHHKGAGLMVGLNTVVRKFEERVDSLRSLGFIVGYSGSCTRVSYEDALIRCNGHLATTPATSSEDAPFSS